ncbi:urea transporter [bacterium LRH843]|nr:urea transporter [bacterium LRH843]
MGMNIRALDLYIERNLHPLFSASLKGVSQVLLVSNAFSGFLILIGLSLFSPSLALMALLSSFVGTWISNYVKSNKEAVLDGIFGFNSVLSGVAVTLYLTDEFKWIVALAAAAVSALFMVAVTNLYSDNKIPILTFPFVMVTWGGILATDNMKAFHVDPAFKYTRAWYLPSDEDPNFFEGLLKGIGEVFIIDSIWAGIFILLALFWAGWRFGVYAIWGTIISWSTARILGVDAELLNLGLYNFNAVLSIIAIGLVFNERKGTFALSSIFAAIMTVPITAGLFVLLQPLGLPALTMPFILSTWIFLAAWKVRAKEA